MPYVRTNGAHIRQEWARTANRSLFYVSFQIDAREFKHSLHVRFFFVFPQEIGGDLRDQQQKSAQCVYLSLRLEAGNCLEIYMLGIR